MSTCSARPALLLAAACAAACGSGQEAAEVPLPVVVSTRGAAAPATSDLGYQVTLVRARLALRDLELTVGGEVHGSALARAWGWLVPSAHAHPGHASGGEVTGVLPGPLLVDWGEDGAPLGTAILLEGDYQGANFTFRRAGAEDDLAPSDPLLGHAIELEAIATRDGDTIWLSAVLDIDEDTPLIGAPFSLEVREGIQATLALALLPAEKIEGKTVWDGVDLAALDGDGDGRVAIRPGEDAHNVLRRAFQVHDFYQIDVR